MAAAAASKKGQPKSAKQTQKKKTTQKTNSSQKDIIPRSDKLDLVIRVKEPVMVTMKKDGTTMYTVIMKKDTVDRISANEIIELEVAKPDALNLTLNGRQISLQPKNNARGIITITRKGVVLK